MNTDDDAVTGSAETAGHRASAHHRTSAQTSVCLVLNDFKRGGAERHVRDLAVQMRDRDEVDVTVVAANPRGELAAEFTENGLHTVVLDVEVSMRSVPSGIAALSSTLRSLDPDLVHSHLSFSHLISRIACTRLSIPHVATYHNVREKRTLPKRAAERALRGLSDRIVCVSEGVRDSYGAASDMAVIYNAIDVRAFERRVSEADTSAVVSTVSPGDTVFLNVARCVRVKRQQDLVRAIARMGSEDVHLFVVGDGPRRSMLEDAVVDAGVSDRVTVTGYVDRVEPYYAVADAFVSSSSREGFPSTHIEAMAARLPVVSTRIPGVTELVDHGVNGYLCPVSDPDSLATYMERIRRDGAESLGEAGFETATAEFSMAEFADAHARLYRGLTAES